MKADLSKVFYEKYFGLKNRAMVVTLNNGRILKGEFIAFYHGDEEYNESYIKYWQIAVEHDSKIFGADMLGFETGEIIAQDDIHKILLEQDQSTIEF